MTTQQLIKNILNRLGKYKYFILLGGFLFSVLFFLYAKNKPVVYSVRSTVFPITSPSQNNSASSRINELLGGGGSSKSITEDANVNIEEVGRSKKTSDAVVAERLPAFGNKLIAQVLIDEYNKYRTFRMAEIKTPKTDSGIITGGSELLRENYTVKFNKNSLLEIVYSSTDPRLVTPVSYILIGKISEFYKELKIKKAKADFEFAEKKVDSFDMVLNRLDSRRVSIDNHTLFVPPAKLQYSIPKENLEYNKLRVLAQRNEAAANRESALWGLQKITPIIEILDKPNPPYDEVKPSKKIFALIGFMLGFFLSALITILPVLKRYAGTQFQTVFEETVTVAHSTTTA